MSKFEMSASTKRRESAITPEIVHGTPPQAADAKILKTQGKSPGVVSPQHLASAFEIAKIIVCGTIEVNKIRANTEAEIKKVELEIQKIIVSTQSEIAKMREENSNWHSQFDARQQAIQKTLKFLESHPEYSDKVKDSIILLTIAGINKQ